MELDEETVAEVDEVLVMSGELSGTDSAAEDDGDEEETEDSDLEIAESSLDSSQPLRSYTLSDDLHCSGKLGGAESEKWKWKP